MEEMPVWYKYAVFDKDGFVSGIRNDAPDYAKKAYEEEKAKEQWYIQNGKPIPK